MPTLNICKECGAEISKQSPDGMCTRCLFQLGMASRTFETTCRPLEAGASCQAASATPLAIAFDDYELIEEVARGGMGIVWKARQVSLNRIVAVKMILGGQLATQNDVRRFRAEAESAARLQHPNIVRIHETGEWGGQPYFSMDYIRGTNMGTFVREGPLSGKRAATLIRVVAGAIHYAHEAGVLHRDLKPSNILVDESGEPRVTDFGLAERVTEQASAVMTGQVLGSPNFMPPEQAGAKVQCGRQSDVYGLGALLFFALTGRPPFAANSVRETLELVLNSEPPPPQLLNPATPRDLATICLKCLEKNPARRYATAQEVADELARFLNDEPILARPATIVEKVWRWRRRQPLVAILSAGVGTLLLAIMMTSPVVILYVDRERKRALASEKKQIELRVEAESARARAEAVQTALLYWQAVNALPAPTEEEVAAIEAFKPLELENGQELAAKYHSTFHLLRRAEGLKAGCNWAVDVSNGPHVSIPRAQKFRQIMNAARLRGDIAVSRGNPGGAWQEVVAILIAARHLAANGDAASVSVQSLIEADLASFIARHYGRFSTMDLIEIQEAVTGAPPRRDTKSGIQAEQSLYGDWFVRQIEAAIKTSAGDEAQALSAIKGLFSQHLPLMNRSWDDDFAEKVVDAAGGTARGVLWYSREALPFYARMRSITTAPPETLAAVGESVLKEVEWSTNLIVAALIPNMHYLRKREMEAVTRLAMLKAAVVLRQSGPGAFERVKDSYGFETFELRPMDEGFELLGRIDEFGLNGRLLFVTNSVVKRP